MCALVQTTKCQLACRMAVAAMSGSSSSLFVEHYIAHVVKVLELLRKQPQERASHSQLWPIITAAFDRLGKLSMSCKQQQINILQSVALSILCCAHAAISEPLTTSEVALSIHA
jgi:hypothetical protein